MFLLNEWRVCAMDNLAMTGKLLGSAYAEYGDKVIGS